MSWSFVQAVLKIFFPLTLEKKGTIHVQRFTAAQ
jgi:hypothetical protein